MSHMKPEIWSHLPVVFVFTGFFPWPISSTSSPFLITPRSILPVITVPRPGIENVSSIGIKNGLSKSRTGKGMCSSIAYT